MRVQNSGGWGGEMILCVGLPLKIFLLIQSALRAADQDIIPKDILTNPLVTSPVVSLL